MLWSQPIAKHVYNYIDIYIHYTHTEAGFTIKTELLHQTSSHWNCWLDTLTQWFIYDSFMAPNRRIPYCWVVASFGPTKKGDLEPNNVQIQTKASSRDYNFTSISLIISVSDSALWTPNFDCSVETKRIQTLRHYVFLFQRSKTTNVLVTSPKYPKAERSIQGTSHVGVRCRTCVESWFPSKLRHMSWWEPRWHTCFLVSHQSHMSYTV